MKQIVKSCAIYTRKSTEEGLEQEFNTLDAQRESCLAYITSQKSEGWSAIKSHYDDGGFSGGNMERPALRQLIDDIKAGKVNIVVVYKIDRLTRSLMDFSKLVEVFDQYGVTFVSVTQSFNTTTSMGRLTLNVLLSFAQFEREVTGERIRDKVAASKKKGMWMGGNPTIGYDLVEKQLIINKQEAQTIRLIFERYLDLGCVAKLKADLEKRGVVSKARVSIKGKQIGGMAFSRGALYHLLRNPIFIGKVKHKDNIYDGMHRAIISDDVWDTVQTKLASQAVQSRGGKKVATDGNLLRGKLFDLEGNFYSPCYADKKGKRYGYYISQTLIQYRHHPKGVLARLPAYDLEKAVIQGLYKNLPNLLVADLREDYKTLDYMAQHIKDISQDILMGMVKKVVVSQEKLTIHINQKLCCGIIADNLQVQLPANVAMLDVFELPFVIKRAQHNAVQIDTPGVLGQPKSLLDLPAQDLKNLVQGTIWREQHFAGLSISQIARQENLSDTVVGKYIYKSMNVSL